MENQSKYFREMISDNKNWNLIGEYIDEGISDAQVNKTKNLLKIKNEYHDIIGHRLALHTKIYRTRYYTKSMLFLLDSIYEVFDSKLSSNEKLDYYLINTKIFITSIIFCWVLCQIVLVDNKFDKCNFVKDDENQPFIMPLIRKIRAIK